MLAKKTLEINPHHSVMKELLSKVKASTDGKIGDAAEDSARMLFHMALLNSGFNIEDPTVFADSLLKMINTGFGLARDQPVEEIQVEIEEEEKSDNQDASADEEEIDLSSDEKENAGQAGEPEVQEIPIEMEG